MGNPLAGAPTIISNRRPASKSLAEYIWALCSCAEQSGKIEQRAQPKELESRTAASSHTAMIHPMI